MTAMIFGVCGTHSTGKSTFCHVASKALQQEGFSVKSIPSFASAAKEAGFPILRDHNHESTLWIIARTIAAELEASLVCDVVLVDRPVPDALGYFRAAMIYRNESLENPSLSRLFDIVRACVPSYAAIFETVLDPAIPIGSNKERDPDSNFRQLAAEQIAIALKALNVNSIQLTSLTIDGAVSEILKIAKRRKL
jgi:hypothetical protein